MQPFRLDNRTRGVVRLAAVNTLGNLYVLSGSDDIRSIEDLRGKSIGLAGKGAVPEIILRWLLQASGADPDDDVKQVFFPQHAETALALAAGSLDAALLPQPFVTVAQMKKASLRVVLDLSEEFHRVSGGSGVLATGCVVIRTAFAETYPETTRAFLTEYRESVRFALENPAETAAAVADFGILPDAVTAERALPHSGLAFLDASDASELLDVFYRVLFDFAPASIGGALPDAVFYLAP